MLSAFPASRGKDVSREDFYAGERDPVRNPFFLTTFMCPRIVSARRRIGAIFIFSAVLYMHR